MSNRGGKRGGAGRKKGSLNQKTIEKTIALEESGLMPLDLFMQVLRDEGKTLSERLEAAKSAAPYVHAKMATQINAEVDIYTIHEDALDELES